MAEKERSLTKHSREREGNMRKCAQCRYIHGGSLASVKEERWREG